jgi:putative MATE family efflux protein
VRSKPALTEGALHTALLKLALPFMVGNGLSLGMLVVDRIWVGRVGTASLAALGTAQAAITVLFTLNMGMAIGTLAGVARSIGAGKREAATEVYGQGLLISSALGLTIALAGFVLPEPVMAFMDAEPAVAGPATEYFAISMWGMLAQAPLILVSFALQGAGEAKAALRVSIVAPLVNVVLDPVFIFGLDLGLAGAAWATMVANVCGLFVALTLVHRGRLSLRTRPGYLTPKLALMQQIVRIGVPGSLEHTVRTVASVSLVKILNGFGAVVVSAYTTSLVVVMMLIFPGIALGQATASLVGQNLGAGHPRRAYHTAWTAVGMYTVVMVVFGSLFAWLAPWIVAAFDPNPAVVAEGTVQIRTFMLTMPATAAALVLGKAFGGAGTTLPAMLSATLAHVVFQLPVVIWLAKSHGPHAAYWGMATAFVLHGAISAMLWVRQFRGRVDGDPGAIKPEA